VLNYLVRSLDITVENETEEAGEPRGDLRVRYNGGFKPETSAIQGNETALIDDTRARFWGTGRGGLEISDARELRVRRATD
jgi:hypothetical protein